MTWLSSNSVSCQCPFFYIQFASLFFFFVSFLAHQTFHPCKNLSFLFLNIKFMYLYYSFFFLLPVFILLLCGTVKTCIGLWLKLVFDNYIMPYWLCYCISLHSCHKNKPKLHCLCYSLNVKSPGEKYSCIYSNTMHKVYISYFYCPQ